MKLNKNDKAFKELTEMANSKSLKLKEYLLNEEYTEEVCKKFYEYLPKWTKMAMNFEKFKVFYSKQKILFVQNIPD